jgi:PAS domain S-box-containing protein
MSKLAERLGYRTTGRWAFGVVAAVVAFYLREAAVARLGPDFPTYVVFYPVVVLVALLAGLGPAIAATAIAALLTAYRILEPVGQWAVHSLADRVGLALFVAMGAFLSGVVELYRYNRRKVIAFETALLRQESEALLRQQREWFRVALTSIGEAVMVVDTAGRITFFNPVAEALTSWSGDEALGQPVGNVFRLTDLTTHTSADDLVERVLRDACLLTLDEQVALVDRTGREIPIESVASPIQERAGVVSGVVFVFHDVTLKRRAAEVSARERANLQAIFNAVNVGLLLLDEQGIVHRTNDTVVRWVGKESAAAGHDAWPGDVINCSHALGNFLGCGHAGPCESCAIRHAWEHALRSGVPVRGVEAEAVLVMDGREVRLWLDVSADPLTIEGRPHVLLAMNNITPLREARQKLLEAKAAAEAANVAKSQFLASMSHELRTPMNVILGMTDLALDEPLSPTIRDYLLTARESAGLLLELLNEILDFSRIEAGRFELEAAPFCLRRTVEQVVKSMGVQAYEKGLELVCDVADDLPETLVGDPLRVRQVLMNLLSNAIKFTPKGEVVVTTLVAERTPLAVTVQFSVADTGIGIAPEHQERVFAPFTQADASTTRRFGGTGLGLAISQRLVGMMGGRIWLQSQPGVGSSFFFTAAFPVVEPPASDLAAPAAPERALFADVPALVVTENATSRRILWQILRSWSMRPEVTADVPAALTKIHEAAGTGHAYRLVLADATMSGIDGFTLAGWLQQDLRLAGPTILMVSTADRQGCLDRCRQVGAVCLDKPVSRSTLFNAVASALGVARPAVPSPVAEPPAPLSVAPLRPLRVLLAEDTPANQKVVSHVLGRRGHSVAVAGHGEAALDMVREQEFDLVLMDVQMPVMDGFQATAEIRKLADPSKARLPIVAMTAHALKGDAERCLAAGMDAYLSKPIKSSELVELVERLGSGNSDAPTLTPETAAAQETNG